MKIHVTCNSCKEDYWVEPATIVTVPDKEFGVYKQVGIFGSKVDHCENCESMDLERTSDDGERLP